MNLCECIGIRIDDILMILITQTQKTKKTRLNQSESQHDLTMLCYFAHDVPGESPK